MSGAGSGASMRSNASTTGTTVAVAVAVAVTLAFASPASAGGPDVGSACDGHELGKTSTASDGTTTIHCIANDAGQMTWYADGGAVQTIADLQAQGYTLTIDQIGDNPLNTCVVTDVHNAMTTSQRVGSGNTIPGGPGSLGNHHTTTITLVKKIDVSLDCS